MDRRSVSVRFVSDKRNQKSTFLLEEVVTLLFLSPLVFLKSINLGSACFYDINQSPNVFISLILTLLPTKQNKTQVTLLAFFLFFFLNCSKNTYEICPLDRFLTAERSVVNYRHKVLQQISLFLFCLFLLSKPYLIHH